MALNMTLQLRVCHYDFLIQAKDLGETNTLLKNIYVGETFSPTYRSQIFVMLVKKGWLKRSVDSRLCCLLVKTYLN